MKKFITIVLLMAFTGILLANNISIGNLSLIGKNTTEKYVMVQFDISWENSWRTSTADPYNWDAAWVFIKYRVPGGEWKHALLNNTGHTAPAECAITPGLLYPDKAFDATTNLAMGAFIFRSADGKGTFAATEVQLRWYYGANSLLDIARVDIQVFAIEMVYVPKGNFYLGTGGLERCHFFCPFSYDDPYEANSNPVTVQGQSIFSNPINLGAKDFDWKEGIDLNHIQNFWIGGGAFTNKKETLTNFPWGYPGFYCMKYEVSQQQYIDFLNTLTKTQATNRYPSSRGMYLANGVYSTTNPYKACSMSILDGLAYGDWAGLRPMSEMEFEKACRGPKKPVKYEYAWGNKNIIRATVIYNPGANNETVNDNANVANNSGVSSPLRVGVFAKANTTREQSGASYYGIMEMSGGQFETVIGVTGPVGRAYNGTHGDGILSIDGFQDVATWPDRNTLGDAGIRGGSWKSDGGSDKDNYFLMQVSDRYYVMSCKQTLRFEGSGFRGIRTQKYP